ncbi:MAG TPA: efflux RND transporter permease subunit [Acidobacteriaceae bacterium]|jgi:multidrug efflux pump subunit AcrB|nr:efflux RND transporter permease subunit [Acidobacteriaceae bacterium]
MKEYKCSPDFSKERNAESDWNLSALAVCQQSVTLFFLLAVVVAGVVAFLRLGRAEDPTFTVKVFTVAVAWPGATAQEMQDLVADPLEKRMQELKYYDYTDTFTRPGLAFMVVNLKDSTLSKDVPEQFYQARKKIFDEAPKLPRGVIPPFVNDEYSDVTFAIYALTAKGMPPRQLTREAEVLRQDMLHVDGVKKVSILGERSERIFVEFSYPRLATLGIGARDIFDALIQENAVTPAGSIDTNDQQVQIRLDGAYDDLQTIRDTPIVASGRTFKLSDIATVERGYEDPATFLIHHNGEPAMELGVVMKDRWNGLKLGKALEEEQKKVQAALPAGIVFQKVTDQSANIRAAVDEFQLKFFVALLVVMVVCLISLGWRVGIVVAAAVPVTLSATLVIMLLTGRNLDRITLGALILSLGLLVDDAIISIETMVVKMEEGWDRINSAAYAWNHTAAPMLAGTLVTIIGLMPIGFSISIAGEYAGNIFWVVAFALLTSWVVAVTFTPYLGVKLLPDIPPIKGGYAAIYETPNYQRLRRLIIKAVEHKFVVAGIVVLIFIAAVFGMGFVKQQFFPSSDRPEVLVEVTLPQGGSIETTEVTVHKLEAFLKTQPEARIVSSYIGAGGPRFFLAYNPELPNPNFAKIIILTQNEKARERLKRHLREAIAAGIAPEAQVRVTQFVFGPPSTWPVQFRISGPDLANVRDYADQMLAVVKDDPHMRQANEDWGDRAPSVHFVLDQARLRLIGLSPSDASQQIQFLLTGVPVTQVREGIRTVDVVARTSGDSRLDPTKLQNMALTSTDGRLIPLSQIGKVEIREEYPYLRRRDRVPTITVQTDIDDTLQPPEAVAELMKKLQPVIARMPPGYKVEVGGPVEDAAKSNLALEAVFPAMLVCMLVVIMIQVRSFPGLAMVMLTGPLGLAGVVPILLISRQPFGFNAILGLIALAGILMRNTLILIGQIKTNKNEGLDDFHAVVEATVQRSRPVVLTALAAVLAFIPLTFSVFWSSLAYTLIGGTAGGTLLTLLFLPALYSIWFRVKPDTAEKLESESPQGISHLPVAT